MATIAPTVQLRSAAGAASPPVHLKWRRGQLFVCRAEADSCADAGQHHLRIAPNGRRVDFNGRHGPWAQFAEAQLDDGRIALQSVGHRDAGRPLYVGLQAVGTNTASPSFVAVEDINDGRAVFEVVAADSAAASASVAAVPIAPSYPLSRDERQRFISEGYLHLPALVAAPLVSAALREINYQLGRKSEAWVVDKDGKQAMTHECRSSAAVMDLLYASPVFGLAEQLLGRPTRPLLGQVALRFPSRDGVDERTDKHWHIDGQRIPHMTPFHLLVGVALSAQPEDDCGNLGLAPGSHKTIHAEVAKRRSAMEAAGHGHGTDGDEDDGGDAGDGDFDQLRPWNGEKPTLPSGVVQPHMQPGDVVLLHQKTAHRVCLNKSPHVRYQVYFRISHELHQPHAPLGGLWKHFDGLVASGDVAADGTDVANVLDVGDVGVC